MKNGISRHGGGIFQLMMQLKKKGDCGRSGNMVVARKITFELRKWLNKGSLQQRKKLKKKR